MSDEELQGKDLLPRIDERTKFIAQQMGQITTTIVDHEKRLTRVEDTIEVIEESSSNIEDNIKRVALPIIQWALIIVITGVALLLIQHFGK